MRTPEQDRRFADETTGAVLAEIQRHAANAVLCAIDASIINTSPDAYPSKAAGWRAYVDMRDRADAHRTRGRILRSALEAYIIRGEDPSAALQEARET